MMRFLFVLNTLLVAAGREPAGADQVTLMQNQIKLERNDAQGNLNEAVAKAGVAPTGKVYLMGPPPFYLPIPVETKVSLQPDYDIDLTNDAYVSVHGKGGSLLQIDVQQDHRPSVTAIIGVLVVFCILSLFFYTVIVYAQAPDPFSVKNQNNKALTIKKDRLKEQVDAMQTRGTRKEALLSDLDESASEAIDKHAKSLQTQVEAHMKSSSDAAEAPSETEPWQKTLLPPVCPTLVLNDCEARCAVEVASVQATKGKSGQLDLIGLSGNQLFRAEFNRAEGGCRLSVSLAHTGSAPRVTVMESTEGGGKMEIKGPGGAHYGWISSKDDGSYEISKGDQSCIVIAGSFADLSLEIRATKDGELISTTSKNKEFVTDDVEHLEFRVMPGFDMVLLVSCVLAVVLVAP